MASLPAEARADPGVRALVTPEGVDLRVRLAAVSERAIALIIDLSSMIGSLIVFTLVVISAMAASPFGESANLVMMIWYLGFFVLRNFYFTLFEGGRRAATPGKRVMGLRVVARDGAALSTDAVVARNAMRELELFLPILFLFARANTIENWTILAGVVWCFVFVLFPLFNRDRLRAGDFIAGTWVLKTPKQTLLPDLTGEGDGKTAPTTFSLAQLDAYGVKELQVLETVLRANNPEAIEKVAARIRTKIGWTKRTDEADRDFLSLYYAALRRRLEQRLLFGVRKRDKHDRA